LLEEFGFSGAGHQAADGDATVFQLGAKRKRDESRNAVVPL
jgi:hypothetical protein